jgi:hypothetical protein
MKAKPMTARAKFRPDWRNIEAKAPRSDSDDTYILRYRSFLQGLIYPRMAVVDDEVESAHSLYIVEAKRAKIEAGFLAGMSVPTIARRLWVYPESIACFEQLYFDIGALSKADADWALLDIANDRNESPIVQQLRLFGFKYGEVFLDWLCSRKKTLDPEQKAEIITWLQTVTLMKASAIQTEDLNSTQRIGVLTKLLATAQRLSPDDATDHVKSDLNKLVEQMRNKLEKTGVPQGLPDLELHLALPVKTK